ncbi:DUF1549 domain-containing protein [Telmatocola sphagniphila]|uniref:DUF1549 domain-containing protein n=1 Tax=Telmatocola sphagniphila TaxID=1123043 RepID=A0A8E6BA65_9BACT|nr:DUF1553 domain-containing protein [Telmatocola sphagniphila]QVL34104.1 DUF1549 domain-containing protein [Telmatocola sphagniphila]
MFRSSVLFLSFLLSWGLLQSSQDPLLWADDNKEKADEKELSFKDILPLLQAKCVRCHGEKIQKAELDLSSPTKIFQGGESGPAVVSRQPDKSPLFEKVHTGAMPPAKNERLTAAEVELLRRWISSGAKSDSEKNREIANDLAGTQHEVIPILLRHCIACHGSRRREGGLDLRTKAAMLKGGKSGPAIVPGKPEESLLVKKIRTSQMPPRDRLLEVSLKPIESSETETLVRWIAAGANEKVVEPDVATTTPDPLVGEKDRSFWSFQPPKKVAVPQPDQAALVKNPIDAFVLRKLESKGLTLSKEADRATLLRRASFDLTGLPPEPAEVKAFLADTSADAYEKLIDRLLASPRYGERWGRYWLDLAGYADSEGKREQDLFRPHAWRYRDYVIRAFNNDKPYNRFLLEQLAGDELVDYEHAAVITPEMADNLVATGFLRMAPDGSWANITGFIPDRLEVIADEMDILGSGLMGLTMKCARCHSHKFDPIPQRDYYRLVDIFKGAYDEYDWLRPDIRPGIGPVSEDRQGGRHLPYVSTEERKNWEATNAQLRKEIEDLKTSLERKTATLAAKFLEERLNQLPEVLRADLRKMVATPPAQRDSVQIYLAGKFEKQLKLDRNALKSVDAAFKKEVEAIEAQLGTLRAGIRPEQRIQALWDRGIPSPTYVYRRGDPLNTGRLVGPGVPSVLTDGKTPFVVTAPWLGANKTGRRLAFAHWLTESEHPLTARVAVNRLWKHHFGVGIVASLGNFGKTGTLPTHPELLDWLAREFVQTGWSMKAMHRLMMTSATYRQSSHLSPKLIELDPDNQLYSRMPLRRMDAESLYDTLLLLAGRLDETRFGPADPVQSRADGLVIPTGTSKGWRRMIYVQQLRKQMISHLENFDFPQMNPNCLERRDSTVAPQALHLLNDGMVEQLAQQFAARVAREAGGDAQKQVEHIYLVAISRLPSQEEMKLGVEALHQLAEEWSKSAKSNKSPEDCQSQALKTYCHAIMNSAGFLYLD